MYKKCPQCGYVRQPEDTVSKNVCPSCGLDFKKWLKQLCATRQDEDSFTTDDEVVHKDSFATALKDTLFYVPSPSDAMSFYFRVLLYVFFVIWGTQFILMDMESNEIGESFLHRVDLVFHEAGHVIFMPLGSFMHTLGGTLGQLLMPLIVTVSFVIKNHDNFGASIGLWWFAQSLMDCAPYINDAQAGQLMLLGGVTGMDAPDYHDWRNMLGRLDLLAYDHTIASFVDGLGVLFMLIAFAWGGVILYLQFKLK